MMAYVTMRGITGHGHYPRDEALEPLVRLMYEPTATETEPESAQKTTTIEAVQEEVNKAIKEMSSEPAEETTMAEPTQEATIQPLHFLELTEPVQDDNRYVDNPLDLHTTVTVIIFVLLLYGGLQGVLVYSL